MIRRLGAGELEVRGFGTGMPMRKKLLLTVIFLLSPAVAFAEPVKLDVKVDRDTITIGDRITYEVVVQYEDGIELEPQTIGKNLGEFEIKDYHIEEPKKTKNKKWISKTSYVITTFTTGEFTIPPVKIQYKDPKGGKKETTSREIKITVESVKKTPNDKGDIRPLKGPEEIKGRFPLVWTFAVLAILLIAGAAAFVYFKKKNDVEELSSVPARPAEDIAMEELKGLLGMGLVEKGMVKEYYIRISDIMRRYIEGKFDVLALDRTTWELYREMRSKRIRRAHVDKIRDFLEECDLVKFAKYIPSQKEIDEVYNIGVEIIEMTKSG